MGPISRGSLVPAPLDHNFPLDTLLKSQNWNKPHGCLGNYLETFEDGVKSISKNITHNDKVISILEHITNCTTLLKEHCDKVKEEAAASGKPGTAGTAPEQVSIRGERSAALYLPAPRSGAASSSSDAQHQQHYIWHSIIYGASMGP
ncbi:unnamed protein product [Ranitomeya imitator]|uniref:Uncharacterized protein n=1 Tax=Ranitomeya imitator TaxID=111125 RepID=A0ABN9ML43_9NEOB|nr:unnamed protein product [Ranitomeya imitator]